MASLCGPLGFTDTSASAQPPAKSYFATSLVPLLKSLCSCLGPEKDGDRPSRFYALKPSRSNGSQDNQGIPGAIAQPPLCFRDAPQNSFIISGTTNPPQGQTGASVVLFWLPSLLRASSSQQVITSQPPSQGSGPDVGRQESGLCSPVPSPMSPSSQIPLLRSQGDEGQRRLGLWVPASREASASSKHSPTVMVAEPGVHSVWLAPLATVARNWKCHLWPEDGNSFFF